MNPVFYITDFGAVGDGKTICSKAIESAVDACVAAGGGTVFVPAGKFLTASILLHSNVRLHIDNGAELLFVQDCDQFATVESRWEGVDGAVYRACIFASDAENITIEGGGTINGQGDYWWKLQKERNLKFPRPRLISLQNCERVVIRGVKLINSPAWTVHPINCRNVLVDGITIVNPADSPNTDGINPESCDGVRIQGCYVSVGDDCLTLKSGTQHARAMIPCQNITVTGCVMVNGHGGVVIGSEMSGGVRNVVISNCVFHKTDRGIRIKSRRGRGGIVEDVRVNNLVMDEVNCPFVLNLYYFCGPDGHEQIVRTRQAQPVNESTPIFRRIHFSNITAKNCRSSAGFIYGLAEQPVEDISFDNVLVMVGKGFEPEMPAMLDDFEPTTRAGFFVGFAKDLDFTRVTVTGADGPAFRVENSTAVRFDGCKAKECTGEMLSLENVN